MRSRFLKLNGSLEQVVKAFIGILIWMASLPVVSAEEVYAPSAEAKPVWAADEARRSRTLPPDRIRGFLRARGAGVSLIEQQRFSDAMNAFEQALSVDPDDYASRMALADCHLKLGNFLTGIDILRSTAAQHPLLSEPRFHESAGLMRMFRYFEAIEPLKKAIDLTDVNFLEAKWNLRVATMHSGQSIDDIPEKYRISIDPGIPPKFPVPKFEDVAKRAGVDEMSKARSSAWRDINGDGWMDLFAAGESSTHAMWLNNRDGTFKKISEEAGVANPEGGWATLWVDYDNDGDGDLAVTRDSWQGPAMNYLYRNNGDLTFTDVALDAGVEGVGDTFCGSWGDYDNDGYVDLYVGNGLSRGGAPNNLYRNNGDGTFTDVAVHAGVNDGIQPTIGVVWGDYDNDGWLDLYVSNYGTGNGLYRNLGNGRFENVAIEAGVVRPTKGFVTFFFDYDNDTWLDLFVACWSDRKTDILLSLASGKPTVTWNRPALYRNNKNGTFTDVTFEAGLARSYGTMSAIYGDINNDGWAEIYLGNGGPPMERFDPDHLFMNNGDGTFSEISEEAGTANIRKGHGASFADYDKDGDLDIYAPQGGAGGNPGDAQRNSLYRNPGNSNHWVSFCAVGGMGRTPDGKVNRDGIGTKMTVKVGGRTLHAHVSGGQGFAVTNPLQLWFGLADKTVVDTLTVLWPTGQTAVYTALEGDQEYEVYEEGGIKAIPRTLTP
jgi:tetratricopeptide (TPR) repeat protein